MCSVIALTHGKRLRRRTVSALFRDTESLFSRSRRDQTGTANDRDIRSSIIATRVTSQILRTLSAVRESDLENSLSLRLFLTLLYSIAITFTQLLFFLLLPLVRRKITAAFFRVTSRRHGLADSGIQHVVKSEPIHGCNPSPMSRDASGDTRAEIRSSTDSLRPRRRGDRQGPPAACRTQRRLPGGCESSAG